MFILEKMFPLPSSIKTQIDTGIRTGEPVVPSFPNMSFSVVTEEGTVDSKLNGRDRSNQMLFFDGSKCKLHMGADFDWESSRVLPKNVPRYEVQHAATWLHDAEGWLKSNGKEEFILDPKKTVTQHIDEIGESWNRRLSRDDPDLWIGESYNRYNEVIGDCPASALVGIMDARSIDIPTYRVGEEKDGTRVEKKILAIAPQYRRETTPNLYNNVMKVRGCSGVKLDGRGLINVRTDLFRIARCCDKSQSYRSSSVASRVEVCVDRR